MKLLVLIFLGLISVVHASISGIQKRGVLRVAMHAEANPPYEFYSDEKELVKDYNTLLSNSINALSSICALAAMFFFFPILDKIVKTHSNKRLQSDAEKRRV